MLNGKVVIGWLPQPIGGMCVLQQGFFDSFFSFCTYDTLNRQVFGGYTYCGTGYIASARDTLCAKFLEVPDMEWLLMVDWDISYSPDSVYALLDVADPIEHPIVAGAYVTYFGDDGGEARLRPCFMETVGGMDHVPAMGLQVGAVTEASTVGMGFTLIHRNVLESMRLFYADDPWHFFGHDIINDSHVGEDITFCSRAKKLGFKSWVHGGVLLGHTKAKTFVVADMANDQFATQPSPLHQRMIEEPAPEPELETVDA